MVTVDDVFHHIAQELRCYSDADQPAAVDEFLTGCTFEYHLTITTDVEESELYHLERYGQGHTFYFRLSYYEHGKILAAQIHHLLTGKVPGLEKYTGNKFSSEDRLYLFIHLRNMLPKPVKRVMDEYGANSYN